MHNTVDYLILIADSLILHRYFDVDIYIYTINTDTRQIDRVTACWGYIYDRGCADKGVKGEGMC